MTYTLIIEKKAEKDFRKLTPPWDNSIQKAIIALAENPRHKGSKKLSGSDDGYRIRVGDYRALYTIDDKTKIITIYRIRHRKEVYR
jgi:mRNA interferase RelE/StbE